MIILSFGLVGVIFQFGSAFVQPYCRDKICTTIQETLLMSSEVCYFVIYMWLLVVTFHRGSSVSKVLNEQEKNSSPQKDEDGKVTKNTEQEFSKSDTSSQV